MAGNYFEVHAFANVAITSKNLIVKVQPCPSNFFDLDINILCAIFYQAFHLKQCKISLQKK